MARSVLAVSVVLFVSSLTISQTTVSDPQAQSLAMKSVTALTGGTAVSDITLNATVTSILGSDNQTGTQDLTAKGLSSSRTDLNLSNGEIRSDVRTSTNGQGGGAWKKSDSAPVVYANHNCKTDAAWFFPALSSLTQTTSPNFVFKYIGQEQHGGVNTQHILVFQKSLTNLLQHLSTIDFYLDPTSALPLAIAFQMHPDNDAARDIPAEVRFADYRSINGVLVPFHVQKMLNGGVIFDITVTSATLNTGLPDTTFNIQ